MANFDWLSDLSPLFNAQACWLDGTYNKTRSEHLFYHSEVPFALACGAGLLAEHVRRFKFSPAIIQRLGQVTDAQGRSVFHESFLNHLQRMRLRTHVIAAPEGTLLLPDEPILSIQGPELQLRLLRSAIEVLIWESTHWATQAAWAQWQKGHISEEDTPAPPPVSHDRNGWQQRAEYIGGSVVFEPNDEPLQTLPPFPGLQRKENGEGQALLQIRRLFRGEQPLGDVWLSAQQDADASVSHSHIQFKDEKTSQMVEVQMSRFQNIWQPVLVKGLPAFSSPSPDYLRQRTWKQLEAFHGVDLDGYGRGWYGGG